MENSVEKIVSLNTGERARKSGSPSLTKRRSIRKEFSKGSVHGAHSRMASMKALKAEVLLHFAMKSAVPTPGELRKALSSSVLLREESAIRTSSIKDIIQKKIISGIRFSLNPIRGNVS